MAFTYIESRFWVRKWSCLTAAFRKKGSPAAAPQFMFGLLLSLFLIKYREEERKCSLPLACVVKKSGKIESFEVLIHHLRVTQIMKAFVQHQPTSNLFWKIGKGEIIYRSFWKKGTFSILEAVPLMAYRFGEPSKVQYSPYCGMLSPGSVVGIDPASQYKWTDMCTN